MTTTLAIPAYTTQRRSAWPLVSALAAAHMLIDAASIYTVSRLMNGGATGYGKQLAIAVEYNMLAFATQAALGWAVDATRSWRWAAACGAGIVAIACAAQGICTQPAIILAGIGNALFHVGAGAICLRCARGRAAMPAVFVAPGDLGVWIGMSCAQSNAIGAVPFVAAAAVSGGAAVLGRFGQTATANGRAPRPVLTVAIVVLCIYIVAVRSLTGDSAGGAWRNVPWVLLAMFMVAMLSKALSGFALDRFGWIWIAFPAAAIAAPFLAARSLHPAVALIGMALTQATMPVTLVALALVLPRHPALALGIASTAIAIGGRPFFTQPLTAATVYTAQFTAAACVLAVIVILRRAGANPARLGA